MIASTMTTAPTTTAVRETFGSLRFRMLKLVDIGQCPPVSTGSGTPGGGASGTCGPGPAGGGGPGKSPGGTPYGGNGFDGPAMGSVRAPGGAGGSGTGTPCRSGGVSPGTPALVIPGVYPGPAGLGADAATFGGTKPGNPP